VGQTARLQAPRRTRFRVLPIRVPPIRPRSRQRRSPNPRTRRLILNPPRLTIVLTSVPITYTSGEQIEVYRFSIPVTVGVPLLALFLQAFLPRRFPFFSIFDLPLLVTIFFAMARRNPISGLFTGAAIGLAQDMLGPYPIGIYGIAKTVVGFGASSLGAKLDVENAGARLLVTLGFYLVHQAVYFGVARYMVSLTLHWSWGHDLLAGLANAVVGVVLYFMLDKFKQRT
jgi:rod shape-determining protein MreD